MAVTKAPMAKIEFDRENPESVFGALKEIIDAVVTMNPHQSWEQKRDAIAGYMGEDVNWNEFLCWWED